MFELFVGVLVGFACGYGIREAISRRRRAVARDRMLKIAEDEYRRDFPDRVKRMAVINR